MKHVVLLMNKPAARNPVITMYARALLPTYRVTVACPDPEAAEAAFPGVSTTSIYGSAGTNPVLRLRERLLARRRSVRRLDANAASSDGTDRGPGAPAAGRATGSAAVRPPRLDRGLLRTHLADVATAFAHLRRLRADAILAIDADVLLAAWSLARAWRCRYAYFMYEIWPDQFDDDPPDVRWTLATIERFGVRRAHVSLVADAVQGTVLVRRYGVPRRRVIVMPTCPELPVIAEPGVVHDPMRFYYHGGLQAGRGIEHLVRAMHDVPDATLAIRGIGPLAEPLRDLIASERLTDRVAMLDPLPVQQLAQAGTEFDVGVNITCPGAANHRFNIGFKTFENMAAGLALLSSRSYILGPFTRRHDVGMTFEGCAAEGVAAALRACVANPERVAHWKRQARAWAEREYNPEFQGRRLRAVFDDLLAPRRPRRQPAGLERPVAAGER